MTDLQDMVLDRLAGTPVGVHWPDGPLTIAAHVVGGKHPIEFGKTDNDREAKSEIARRLSYPVLLCEALQGANRGLKGEDDRRGLAMTLFGRIPLGSDPPRLLARDQNRIALRMALRAHPYVCAASCAVSRVLADLLRAPAVTRPMAAEAAGTPCQAAGGPVAVKAIGWLSAGRTTAVQRLLQTVVMALRGFERSKSVHSCARSASRPAWPPRSGG